jgi:hypothetical protein
MILTWPTRKRRGVLAETDSAAAETSGKTEPASASA